MTEEKLDEFALKLNRLLVRWMPKSESEAVRIIKPTLKEVYERGKEDGAESVMEDVRGEPDRLVGRRRFVQMLAAAGLGSTYDLDKLLWMPGAKTIFIPTFSPWSYRVYPPSNSRPGVECHQLTFTHRVGEFYSVYMNVENRTVSHSSIDFNPREFLEHRLKSDLSRRGIRFGG